MKSTISHIGRGAHTQEGHKSNIGYTVSGPDLKLINDESMKDTQTTAKTNRGQRNAKSTTLLSNPTSPKTIDTATTNYQTV